ncbi:MAG: tetratricopeptide repeat protein, partial [Candidatus Thermoplasmatota archaeon]|nr:tetratricopeptide repeat protein [Candidatus Thermoplasmatota archaeon]
IDENGLAGVLGPEFKELFEAQKPPRLDLALPVSKDGLSMGEVSRPGFDVDPDILAGRMEAVRSFTKDSLSLDERDSAGTLERFELHGFCLLTCMGQHMNLSLVLRGNVTRSLKEDLLDVVAKIEKTYSSVLPGWVGDMPDVQGIPEFIHDRFFASKKYDGEWDADELRSRGAQAMEEVLVMLEHESKDSPQVVVIGGFERADPFTLAAVKHIARNIEESPVAVILLFSPGDTESVELWKTIKDMSGGHNVIRFELEAFMDENHTISLLDEFMKSGKTNEELTCMIWLLGGYEGVKRDMLAAALEMDAADLEGCVKELELLNLAVEGNLAGSRIRAMLAEKIERMEPKKRTETLEKLWRAGKESMIKNNMDSPNVAKFLPEMVARAPSETSDAVAYLLGRSDDDFANLRVESGLEKLRTAVTLDSDVERKKANMLQLASFDLMMGAWRELEMDAKAMVEIGEGVGDRRLTGIAHLYLAKHHAEASEFEKAAKELITAAKFLGGESKEDRIEYLLAVGFVSYLGGDLDKAEKAYEETLMLAEETHDLYSSGRALNNLGIITGTRDMHEAARDHFLKCHEIYEKIGKRGRSRAVLLSNITAVYYRLKEYNSAIEWGKECADYCLETRNAVLLPVALQSTARSHLSLREIEKAERDIESAVAYSQRIESTPQLYVSKCIQAEIAYAKATRITREAEKMREGLDSKATNVQFGSKVLRDAAKKVKEDMRECLGE